MLPRYEPNSDFFTRPPTDLARCDQKWPQSELVTFGHIFENFQTIFFDREKFDFFLELENFLDMYSDAELHALSNGDNFRAIPALHHGLWER